MMDCVHAGPVGRAGTATGAVVGTGKGVAAGTGKDAAAGTRGSSMDQCSPRSQ